MLEITFPRGDMVSKIIAVREKSTGDITDLEFDDIYFTVKRQYLNKEYNIQKRLSDGSITKDDDGYYHLTLLPEDTDKLPFGEYDFDIELVKNGAIKQTTVGILTLTREVTFASNEE